MANTDPILTSESSVDRGFWNKGSLQVDGAFVLPTVDTEFTNPDLRYSGKLRYNDVDEVPEFNNGTEWKKWAVKTSDLENDGEDGESPYATINDLDITDFNFNNVTIPTGSEPLIDLGGTDGVREQGNVFFDENTNQWVSTISRYTKPYSADGARIWLITSPDGENWTIISQLTSTASEDPYLHFWNGNYYLWVEKKNAGANLDIELWKSSTLDSGYVSLGIVLARGASGQWDNIDVSSPTPRIEPDGTTYLYYEGRGSAGTIGGIGLAVASTPEGTYVKDSGNPLIFGYQYSEIGQWYAGGVPDDITKIGTNYYMMTHMWNGDVFGASVFISQDGLIWMDYLQTWMNTGKNNEISSQGIMMYFKDRKINCLLNSSENLYRGYFNVAKNDNWDYIVRATSTTTTNKIKGASRNQIIESNISANATFVIGRDDSTLDGCVKIFRNTSAFTLTIDPDTDVTINGGTSNVDILAGQMCMMYTTAANTWKTYVYQDAFVSGTSLKTVGGTSLLGSGDVSEIDNNLTASTTRGASKTAINTGLSTKITDGGDTKGAAISIGTNDNNTFSLKHNGTEQIRLTSSNIRIPEGIALANLTATGRFSLNFGTSSASGTASRNIADSVAAMRTDNANASSTGAIHEFASNGSVVASVKKDGKITAVAGTSPTDVVVKSQLDAANRSVINDSYTTVKTTAELEADYPSVPLPYYVIAKNTTGNPIIYIKHSVNVWMFQPLGFTS